MFKRNFLLTVAAVITFLYFILAGIAQSYCLSPSSDYRRKEPPSVWGPTFAQKIARIEKGLERLRKGEAERAEMAFLNRALESFLKEIEKLSKSDRKAPLALEKWMREQWALWKDSFLGSENYDFLLRVEERVGRAISPVKDELLREVLEKRALASAI